MKVERPPPMRPAKADLVSGLHEEGLMNNVVGINVVGGGIKGILFSAIFYFVYDYSKGNSL